MAGGDTSPGLRARLQTMRIIHLALLTGCITFAALAVYLRLLPGAAVPAQPVVSFAGIAFATVMAMAAVAVPGMLTANWRRKLALGLDPLSSRPPQPDEE